MTKLARSILLTLACLTLVACKETPSVGPASAESVAPKATATSSAPAASASAASATAAGASTASTATAATTATRASPQGADATAGKAVEQKQGSDYWAVYTVRAAKMDDPAVKASIGALTKRGLQLGKTFGFGSLGCDVGAAAALKASDDTNAVGVYFATQADAKAFAATLDTPALAVVKIKAMCRD